MYACVYVCKYACIWHAVFAWRGIMFMFCNLVIITILSIDNLKVKVQEKS